MTHVCDLTNHPRACVITQQRYQRPECERCDVGRQRLKQAEGATIPVATATENKDLTEKKEATTVLQKKTPGEKVLGLIERAHAKGEAITPSLMMQRCALTSTEARDTAEELLKAGKIKAWCGPRNATLYTLPDAPNPFPPAEASGKDPAPPPQPREKKKKSAAVPGKPRTPRPADVPASSKTAFVAVIECLKAQRDRIDIAIEALEGIA